MIKQLYLLTELYIAIILALFYDQYDHKFSVVL